jgi:hypothetical protein
LNSLPGQPTQNLPRRPPPRRKIPPHRPQSGRSPTHPHCPNQPQTPRHPHHHLLRRPSCQRSHRPEKDRHRLQTHANPRLSSQRQKRPLYLTFPQNPRPAPPLRPTIQTPRIPLRRSLQPTLFRPQHPSHSQICPPNRRHRKTRHRPHPPPQLRHPPPRSRHRPPLHPIPTGPRIVPHHRNLHPHHHQRLRPNQKPFGQPRYLTAICLTGLLNKIINFASLYCLDTRCYIY